MVSRRRFHEDRGRYPAHILGALQGLVDSHQRTHGGLMFQPLLASRAQHEDPGGHKQHHQNQELQKPPHEHTLYK
jgi:hypothetical protein